MSGKNIVDILLVTLGYILVTPLLMASEIFFKKNRIEIFQLLYTWEIWIFLGNGDVLGESGNF